MHVIAFFICVIGSRWAIGPQGASIVWTGLDRSLRLFKNKPFPIALGCLFFVSILCAPCMALPDPLSGIWNGFLMIIATHGDPKMTQKMNSSTDLKSYIQRCFLPMAVFLASDASMALIVSCSFALTQWLEQHQPQHMACARLQTITRMMLDISARVMCALMALPDIKKIKTYGSETPDRCIAHMMGRDHRFILLVFFIISIIFDIL